MSDRVLKSGVHKITQKYTKGKHDGIDIVDYSSGKCTLGYIVAHSDGEVVGCRDNCNGFEKGSYGNYVKIKHKGGYYTLYAHLKYRSLPIKKGDKVTKGQVIGYMGNTGYSFGGHLHFEVRNSSDIKMDPTKYLEEDLPKSETIKTKFKIGDIVEITGVYSSSTSDKKLKPAIDVGMITRIVEGTRNPYLLNNGQIGWVNDNCIKVTNDSFKVGDIVIPIKLKDVNGTSLKQYDDEYTIKIIKNKTASLYANRNGKYYLWAVLPFDNIKKKEK